MRFWTTAPLLFSMHAVHAGPRFFWTSRPLYLQDVAVWSFIRTPVRGGHFSGPSWRTEQRGYGSSAVLHVPGGAGGAQKVTTHTLLPYRYQVSIADPRRLENNQKGPESTYRKLLITSGSRRGSGFSHENNLFPECLRVRGQYGQRNIKDLKQKGVWGDEASHPGSCRCGEKNMQRNYLKVLRCLLWLACAC